MYFPILKTLNSRFQKNVAIFIITDNIDNIPRVHNSLYSIFLVIQICTCITVFDVCSVAKDIRSCCSIDSVLLLIKLPLDKAFQSSLMDCVLEPDPDPNELVLDIDRVLRVGTETLIAIRQ